MGKRVIYPAIRRPVRLERGVFLSERFIKILATGFGAGRTPFAPGTAGTLAGIPVVLIFSPLAWPLQLLSVLALTCLACYVSQEAEKIFCKKDATRIVIDEIAGFCWTMLLVAPTMVHTAIGFVLFRIFDIVKPFPAGYVQRKWPGGLGVVGDDVFAGIYANVLLQILIRWWNI